MKKFLVMLIAMISGAAVAQQTQSAADLFQQKNEVQPLSSMACQSTFTSGSGQTYLSFCVTQNGNLGTFYSPSGYRQLYPGGEGYAICDWSNNNYSYRDFGLYGDSGNWLSSTTVQPNGPNTFPLTIKRTTSDGVWTLTQVFSRNTNTPSVKITMTLRNNSGAGRAAYFERFADIDASGISFNEFDGATASVWGYQSGRNGLMMRESWPYGMGTWVLSGPPADPCTLQQEGIPYLGDGTVLSTWEHTVPAQSSMTVSVEYRPID